VFNKKTGQKLSATISIINVESGEVAAGITSDGTNGAFTVTLPAGVTYAMHVTAKGYLFYSANFNIKHADKGITLEPLQVPLSPIEIGEQITLRNIFFETAQYELLPTSKVELKTLLDILEKNPQIKVEIAGHTDNVGKSEANQTLSEQRAQSVYNWLIENGIDESRLSYQGYGDSKPIATNDTEQGRSQNRRTTMTIIGE
ncbi:MAG: OmpA family protein, partial [Bacteroidales bacterium]|nr:OmpA family protein [Candidatus Colimorpha onthohippi]